MVIPARCLTAIDPRFGEVADDVVRRTTPYLLTDHRPDEEGKKDHLMLYSVIVGLHQEQTSDHGNGRP